MRRHVGGSEGGREGRGGGGGDGGGGRTVLYRRCVYLRRLGGIVQVPEFNHARRR